MPLKYVTDGAWGTGLGRPLTPLERDQNMRYIEERTRGLSLPSSETIAEINELTSTANEIVMTDATTYEIEMPFVQIEYVGDFVPFASYSVGNVLTSGENNYLVLQDHVAEAVFSASQDSTLGQSLYSLLGSGGSVEHTVVALYDTTGSVEFTPTLGQANAHILFQEYDGVAYFHVPTDEDVPFPIGTFFDIFNQTFSTASEAVEVLFPTGVTVNSKGGYSSSAWGAAMTLIKVGADEWDLYGQVSSS